MATLTFRFNNIVDLINKLKPVNILVYIDMKLNNVVIHYSPKDEQNKEFLNSVKEYMPTLIQPNIVKHHHPRCDETEISHTQILKRSQIKRKILNGEVIFNELIRMCSVGFWAKNNKNENLNYIVTAGHCCVDRSQYFHHLPWNYRRIYGSTRVGEMIESSNNVKYDFCLVNVTEDVNLPTVIRNTDSEYYDELFIEGGKNITSYGSHLCKSGQITHVTCGYVKGLNAFSLLPAGQMITDLIVASKEFFETVCQGDSGGPAFSYLQDLSTVSLNAMTIRVWNDLSIFLPLHVILSKGEVELVRSR
ncbi:S1 family peptidase [Gigaspora margarita]|uniref:S1 family peptidase n=1 Tax=Gigaspora margarita TaxID=4874 RepID=A0A8H3XKY6_GIGMA|nr:S1 family peptidase [Gigaspora margarita]